MLLIQQVLNCLFSLIDKCLSTTNVSCVCDAVSFAQKVQHSRNRYLCFILNTSNTHAILT